MYDLENGQESRGFELHTSYHIRHLHSPRILYFKVPISTLHLIFNLILPGYLKLFIEKQYL